MHAGARPVVLCIVVFCTRYVNDVAVLYDPQIRNVMSELRGDVMIAVYALYCFPILLSRCSSVSQGLNYHIGKKTTIKRGT